MLFIWCCSYGLKYLTGKPKVSSYETSTFTLARGRRRRIAHGYEF